MSAISLRPCPPLAGSAPLCGHSSASSASSCEIIGPYELSCEGQPLDAFPTLERARRAAEAAADLTDCPHEIWHTPTRTLVATIDPPAAA